jgi:hypothetical protein
MTEIKTIAILTHLRQGLDPDYYLARCQRQAWENEGRRVLVHQGTGPPPPADVAFLHVDLTQVPADYVALAASYPFCANAAVADVSKRRISRSLVGEDDAYDGAVIVKTDRNHRGLSEQRLRRAGAGRWAGLRETARRWLPPAWGGGGGRDYQLFERKEQVPRWVWRRRDLVVERFFMERHGEHFALHQWFFLGERGYASTLLSTEPMVKWANSTGAEPFHHAVPESLWRRRRELGFDYGKFDYIVQDGEAMLLDANPTPHYVISELTSESYWVAGVLGAGIDTLTNR